MVNYAKINLQQGIYPYPASDLFQFKGDGWDVGYNLGLLWQPQEKVSIGASFRSKMEPELHGYSEASGIGPYSYRTDAHAELPLPLNAVFGISYRPTPNWNFEFDADYTDWSTEGTLTINQSGLSPVSKPLDWQSSWYYEWGATRYFGNGWHVSAGYIFNENSVPDANYTPLVADLNRHFFSVGVGHKGKSFDFDIAYQFGYGPTRTVSGATGLSAPANGDYTFISHAVSVSAGWHF